MIVCGNCRKLLPGPGVFRRELGLFGMRVCAECDREITAKGDTDE